MRSAWIVGVLMVAVTAHADPAAPVRAVIDGTQRYFPDPSAFGKLAGVWLLGPDGMPIANRFDDALIAFHGPDPRIIFEIDWKLGALTLATDEARGFTWFQAPVSLAIKLPYGTACCDTLPTALRASGIVVRDAKDQPWRLAALALSRQLSDADLFRGATEALPDGEPLADDTDLGKQAAAWFPAKGDTLLARNAAAGATVVASGTAPTEYATGPAAGKLVAAWDKIGIRAKTVEARTFARDTIGLVEVKAGLPRKKAAAPMVLYAIAIRDGKKWKWVSLQWTTELAKPPFAPPETNGSVPPEHAP
ncbi:MAG TPA: hypothetical protein VF469_13780 [Kofleriaceae bacterium]